jgi:hypothetical protein
MGFDSSSLTGSADSNVLASFGASRSWRFARQPSSGSSAHAPAEIRFHCL